MKIYIVTSGSYSDYSIEAVFTDKEKARDFCRFNNHDADPGYCTLDEHGDIDWESDQCVSEYRVEVWETDEEIVTIPPGKHGYEVFISRNGETSVVEKRSLAEVLGSSKTKVCCYSADHGLYNFGDDPKNVFVGKRFMKTKMLARGEEHALKIANEQRAQLIALGRWPTIFNNYHWAYVEVEGEEQ